MFLYSRSTTDAALFTSSVTLKTTRAIDFDHLPTNRIVQDCRRGLQALETVVCGCY